MNIGYARVSTDDQDQSLQISELEKAGCERIFQDKASGGKINRPELGEMLDQLRTGDVVVVWKLDRLSRSLKDLIILADRIGEARARLKSITEGFDTTTPQGEAMMQMIGVFAQFERSMIRERTLAGLHEAREQGRVGGRPKALADDQIEEVMKMKKRGRKLGEIAKLFNVSESTVRRVFCQG